MQIKNVKPALTIGTLAASLIFSSQLLALEPQAISTVGGVSFIPTISVDEAYDDNIRRAPGDEVESMVTTVVPSLLMRAEDRLNTYQFNYDLSRREVHSSQENSSTGHDARAVAHIEFNARNRLDFDAHYVEKTDEVTTTNRFFNESGNEAQLFDTGLIYGFGAATAAAQVELGANLGRVRYDNNFDSGSFNRLREYDRNSASAAFYYRVGAKTRVFSELIYADYDYVSSASLLDGDSKTYRLGMEWKATAKTTGRIAMGREKRDYDDASVSSESSPSWAASVVWQPKTYSSFTLSSRSLIREGGSSESSSESQSVELAWDHSWNSKVISHIGYGFESNDYSGATNDGRDDDIDTLNFRLNYKMRRWLEAGLYYKYAESDSNDVSSEYERNILGVNVKMSL